MHRNIRLALAAWLLIALPAAAEPDNDAPPPGRPALPALEARLLALRSDPWPTQEAPIVWLSWTVFICPQARSIRGWMIP